LNSSIIVLMILAIGISVAATSTLQSVNAASTSSSTDPAAITAAAKAATANSLRNTAQQIASLQHSDQARTTVLNTINGVANSLSTCDSCG